MKKHIPNLITLANLFLGCLALVSIFQGAYQRAAIFLAAAAVCDILDGLLARLLGAYSSLGKELDSLADMLSFGVVPSVMAFFILQEKVQNLSSSVFGLLPYAAFFMAICSAYRLAKFNIDHEQEYYFKGMPTPLNALFWICLLISEQINLIPLSVLACLPFLMGILMISEIKMFSLKARSWAWKTQKIIFIYLLACMASLVIFRAFGLAVVLLAYPLVSIWYFKVQLKKQINT